MVQKIWLEHDSLGNFKYIHSKMELNCLIVNNIREVDSKANLGEFLPVLVFPKTKVTDSMVDGVRWILGK